MAVQALTVVLVLLTSSSRGIQITITQGPSNITAYVGESVTLQCHYTGTINQPKWRIGGVTYTSTNLPAGYRPTREGLHIPSVWAELNNTLYVCFFTVFVAQNGRFENIESNPAIIIVRIRSDRSTDNQSSFVTVTTSTTVELNKLLMPTADRISPTSSDFLLHGSNTGYFSSSSISPTLQLPTTKHVYSWIRSATTTPLLTIEYSSWPSISATPERHLKQMQTSTLLISGISAGVMIFLLISVVVLTWLTVHLLLRAHRKQTTEKPTADPVYEEPEGFKLQEVSTEPEYEKPEALCKLHKNIAYEISPSGIKTAQNEAYAAVANTSLEI